jgi:hypothetical protein
VHCTYYSTEVSSHGRFLDNHNILFLAMHPVIVFLFNRRGMNVGVCHQNNQYIDQLMIVEAVFLMDDI